MSTLTRSPRKRRGAPVTPAPRCNPVGDLTPLVPGSLELRTCTLCAREVRAVERGGEWVAVDLWGREMGFAPLPAMCSCTPEPFDKFAETGRFYGHVIPASSWGQTMRYHVHNFRGGVDLYLHYHAPLSECFTMPPTLRSRASREFEGVDVPTCCGRPMRAVPGGWRCRLSEQMFDSASSLAEVA